ncbi:hypothetical protein ACFXGA_27045 [Actinosynnema sp. NPDC059335]|uniref:hypothetical protein n=1 Tax=Actinosynnema sp. NPDC059335 TaxID=3346804 RepID=UPI00366C0A9F
MASRTTRRRRSRAYRAARRYHRDPWAEPTAREVWQHKHRQDREDARDVATGLKCGACGRPVGEDYPRCPSCPPDETPGHSPEYDPDTSVWRLPDAERQRLLAEADAAELAVQHHDRRIITRHENEE